MTFHHQAMGLNEETKIVFIVMTKHVFYFRRLAVKHVLDCGFTPISQYGVFDYFLTDAVDRDLVRRANNNLMRVADELWVYGPVSDGVLAEIKMKKGKIPIKYFQIKDNKTAVEIQPQDVEFEDEVKQYQKEIL